MSSISFCQSTAKIAAWNLAGGITGISEERIKQQINGLSLLDAEIVALVEVHPISVIEVIVAGLKKKGLDYKFTILEQENKLHIGVIYKKGIEIDNPRFIDGSDLGKSSLRKAFVVDMKAGKFDFTLIAVHLKSSRSKENSEIRSEQADVISAFIKDFRENVRENEDVLLVGDFNMIPGQDTENFHRLSAGSTMDFLSSWDLQDRYSHILSSGRANLLDGFAINKKFSPEYIRGSIRVFQMH